MSEVICIRVTILHSFVTSLSLFFHIACASLASAADHTINKCIIAYFIYVYFYMAAHCASVAKSTFYPRNWATFSSVAAECFSTLWIDATPLMQYLPPEHDWGSFGLVLRNNWADFVLKTWKPCSYSSFAHACQFRTMICSHLKQQCEQLYKKNHSCLLPGLSFGF